MGYGDSALRNSTTTSPRSSRGSEPLDDVRRRGDRLLSLIRDCKCSNISRYEPKPIAHAAVSFLLTKCDLADGAANRSISTPGHSRDTRDVPELHGKRIRFNCDPGSGHRRHVRGL